MSPMAAREASLFNSKETSMFTFLIDLITEKGRGIHT